MSKDLLNYCLEKLLDKPVALTIRQPLDDAAFAWFERAWSKARFEAQQTSILQLPPEHEDYGRSYLWWYNIEQDVPLHLAGSCNLRIIRTLYPKLKPRELILLSSVSETGIPFPYPKNVFRAVKSRLLGRESARMSSAVLPALRPGVANVQYVCQGSTGYLTARALSDLVSVEN